MNDNTYKYALPRLAEGIRKATDLVAPTMGAGGTNVLIQHKLAPGHLLTNDGATVIKSIELADPIENMGLGFLKEAVERSNSNSGDGSTTTTVLLNAIIQEGIKSGVSTLEIKSSLDACLPIIEKSLDEQTKQITVEDIPAVAAIAGENEGLAGTLGAIYKVIGKEGIVHLEGSGTYDTSFNIVEGVRFQGTGYLSPFMAHDDEAAKAGRKETKAVYHNPSILVTKRKISHLNEINPLLGALQAQNKKDLVVFTDDMDSGVAQVLIEAHKSKVINLLIIKAPVLFKGYVFEDFAKCVGATVVEDASGITFKNLQLDHLGTCGTVIVDKDETTLIGINDLTDHLEAIRSDETLPKQDKDIRLAYLCTKTAILKLGAKSETELSYLRLKAEDAIHSSRLALQGGIVAGGGVALRNATESLPDSIGGKILREALVAPIRQIASNAGWSQEHTVDKTFLGFGDAFDGKNPTKGFDAKTGKIVDMFEANIVDASLVVKGAVRNALGIASTLLTTSSVITLPPESTKPLQAHYPFQ